MNLDKLIIVLRQRNPWEAMDLGVKLMRVLWPVILFPWFILLSAVLIFALFMSYQKYWYFASLFIWWIKPVYESMILYILSRSIFAEYPSTSDVFSSISEWLKTGILTTLFFWRLSPSRSFNMPVHQLEGLKGRDRKKRLLALHRVSGSHSMAITIIGVHFEYVLALTLYILIFYFAPDTSVEFLKSMALNNEEETIWYMLGIVIYGVVLFILEPFYIAAGFMLYLNRRTQLEGWDIELDFRKLSARIESQAEAANRV